MNASDKVVCIDDSPCKCGHPKCLGLMPISRGSIYVVEGHYRCRDYLILLLVGVPRVANHRRGVNAQRFRKLDEMRQQAIMAVAAPNPAPLENKF